MGNNILGIVFLIALHSPLAYIVYFFRILPLFVTITTIIVDGNTIHDSSNRNNKSFM